MVRLSSWVRWPSRLNIWTRRRFDPDPDGCFVVDIVSEYGIVFNDGSCVYISMRCDVLSLSLVRSLCISIE